MGKTVIFSIDSLLSRSGNMYDGVNEMLDQLKAQGHNCIIISHDNTKLNKFKKIYFDCECCHRSEIRAKIDRIGREYCTIIGIHDEDLYVAANKKILLIYPNWSELKGNKALFYGVSLENPKSINKLLRILDNQQTWYYELEVGKNVKVLSLTRANSKIWNQSQSELELIQGFNALLKKGNKKYYKVLLCHFLAAIRNNPEFEEVDIWGIMPSSGIEFNEDMMLFKEQVRYLMNNRKSDNILLRHTQAQKSHMMSTDTRLLKGCTRHFDTININPVYKNKLKGKTICILDDYLTNGTSFESVRNLLLEAGAKKIIFVSLGRFKRNQGIEYQVENYNISGDLFTANGYSYNLFNKQYINGVYNESAIEEINNLHEIIYS